MALIICCGCERQRKISPIKRNIYTCSNCGAKHPRIIRRQKIWANWEDSPGIVKIEALRRTYAGLRWLAENKKFKPKYADAKFRSIFGYWPPDEIIDVPPYVLSQNLLWWITRSNQAWKKAKRLEEQTKAPQVILRLPASEDTLSPFMTAEDWGVEL
jgi:hypothetical protein